MINRSLYRNLWQEISENKQMVFLSGPRQTGKTTFARIIQKSCKNSLYYNYDLPGSKKTIIDNPAFFQDVDRKDNTRPLIILDEIHKHLRWKNYLKGIYDGYSDSFKFMVLGSGRLSVFQKGGDSLAGRYFLFHMWPFTFSELYESRFPFDGFMNNPLRLHDDFDWGKAMEIWNIIADIGGFPEPFISGKKTFYRRWWNTYQKQLIQEDIRNMTEIKNIDDMELLFSLLPSRVGSPLSMENLARDIQISPSTVKRWLQIFERFFLCFRITPWSGKISRAITKEKKVYFYNCAAVNDAPARFENMAAVELMRAVNNWNDLGLGAFSLHYIRNKQKEEVDFLIADNRKPLLLVEAKLNDDRVAGPLKKFQDILQIPAVHLSGSRESFKLINNNKQNILITGAPRWFAGLP
ncbi:MAG: ATP-binding protein [bacterium]